METKKESPDAASTDRACEGVNMTEEEKKAAQKKQRLGTQRNK